MIAALLALALAAANESGFHYVEQRRFYDVEADDLATARRRMRELQLHGPNDDPSSGMTTQRVEIAYETERYGSACSLSDVSVHVNVEIVLPRLVTSRKRTDRDLRARWDRMIAGLTAHEDGHRANIERAGRDLHARLVALGPLDCKALRREAQRVNDAVILRLQIRDQIYDQRTQHGVRQGSVL